jgi:hypothetical protein
MDGKIVLSGGSTLWEKIITGRENGGKKKKYK